MSICAFFRRLGIRIFHEREILEAAAEFQKERQEPPRPVPVLVSIDTPGEFVNIDRIIRQGK